MFDGFELGVVTLPGRPHTVYAERGQTVISPNHEPSGMATQPAARRLHCLNCGHSEVADGAWETVEDPHLGSLTQCPDCGSTRVEQVVD